MVAGQRQAEGGSRTDPLRSNFERPTVGLRQWAADHLRGESRQAGGIREHVEIALIESVECEDHDGLAFAGDSAGMQSANNSKAGHCRAAYIIDIEGMLNGRPVPPLRRHDPTLGLQATTDLFVNGFKGSIDGYKETNRQSGTDRQ